MRLAAKACRVLAGRVSHCVRIPMNGCVAVVRGVISTSATSSPGNPIANGNQGNAVASSPDVWDDIVGPSGFLQQFENKLFGVDESRSSSSAIQPTGLSESSAGMLEAIAAAATALDCQRCFSS